jgi:hypothetical protein
MGVLVVSLGVDVIRKSTVTASSGMLEAVLGRSVDNYCAV